MVSEGLVGLIMFNDDVLLWLMIEMLCFVEVVEVVGLVLELYLIV